MNKEEKPADAADRGQKRASRKRLRIITSRIEEMVSISSALLALYIASTLVSFSLLSRFASSEYVALASASALIPVVGVVAGWLTERARRIAAQAAVIHSVEKDLFGAINQDIERLLEVSS